MNKNIEDNKVFSKHYSTDVDKHKDGPKFRRRILKYLEDFVNDGWPYNTYRYCRRELGIDIEKKIDQSALTTPLSYLYCVENAFSNLDINDILDFITVVYDSIETECKSSGFQNKLKDYIDEINRIFKEESMKYVLHENGRVRYYPDEEFEKLTRSTLVILNKPKYSSYLESFDNVLDDFYRNRSKELPIEELFDCIETFVLTVISNKSYNRLNEGSIDSMLQIIKDKIDQGNTYNNHDQEALKNMNNIFLKWVGMCNKYRHGKANQENKDVPEELFNYIFSLGVSIFRFLLEAIDKYKVPLPTNK